MPRTLLPPKPFIPAPNCASVEIFYSINGIICENVFNVNKGSPFSSSDLVALRGVVDSWDNTSWKTARGTAASVFRYRCKALDTNSSPVDDFYLTTPRAGTVSSGLLPANVSLAIKLATARGGRSYRGRWYWCGICFVHLDSNPNKMVPATVTAIVALLNTLKTNLASGGYTLGVLSYATAKAWRTTAHFEPATGYVAVDVNVDSQSRRLTGRGI